MTKMLLNNDLIDAVTLGGAVLGGGGGGSLTEGRRNGRLALEWGAPVLVDVDDVAPETVLVTCSAVGSPASKTTYALPVHYVRAAELLRNAGVPIGGFMSSECGGLACTNGWMQAAALGLPIIDAPCNGRAHPVGIMGSMGLHLEADYVSIQSGVGGDPAQGRYVELVVRGKLDKAVALILQGAIQSGGMVAVARNPVTASYARENAAPGALKHSIAVGQAMLNAEPAGALNMIEAASAELGGAIAGRGCIVDLKLETRGGLDVGEVRVASGAHEALVLSFWNEYMTLEVEGGALSRRIATFPDLMATFDVKTGLPLSTAMLVEGQEIAVVTVPRQKLILGAGMRYPELLRAVETTMGKEINRYVFS